MRIKQEYICKTSTVPGTKLMLNNYFLPPLPILKATEAIWVTLGTICHVLILCQLSAKGLIQYFTSL